jgi:hypothetical protein
VILIQENFLHYLWKYKIFAVNKLQTTNNIDLQILRSGDHNLNSGPDFFNAKIKIGNQVWAGNVEIHVKASDWYLHHHEKDKNYGNVILHVVWKNDIEVFHRNNLPIPTLELEGFVSKKVVHQYQILFSHKSKWISCENSIATIDKFILNNWIEVLYFERLKQKSKLIDELLKSSANDWDTVLFQLLAKNFGLKVNGEAFLNLATSIDFKIIRKEQSSLINLEAILFGQAGFLNEKKEEKYYNNLQIEYIYLKSKYKLEPLFNGQFQFFRLRPNNFPTIRLAQLSLLYFTHQNLFSIILKLKKIEDYYKLFDINTSEFWRQHYSFTTKSVNRSKNITKQFVNLLLLNTIIPLIFMYHKHTGTIREINILNLAYEIPVETNNIIEKFSTLLNVNDKQDNKIKNALESQAFLQLKSAYCNKRRCLQCAIGNSFLNR